MAVSKTRRTRILGAATAFIGVGAAGLMMAAPATAEVTKIDIPTPSGYGSSAGTYGTSCAYKIEATVNDADTSHLVDFTYTKDGGDPQVLKANVAPSNLVASTTWTPTEPGEYVISAKQDDGTLTQSTDKLTVKQGINLDPGGDTGSLTIVSPLQAGCLVIG